MATHSIKTVQQIPAGLQQVWSFFSDPANLQQITPGNMSFRIISNHHGKKIYAGQVIEYKIKPFLGIPWYWMTEITHVADQQYFIDEQRFGPYSLWHHQHHFAEGYHGVEMTDLVHYKIPLGFMGEIANGLFIKKKLQEIFRYRIEKVEEIFGRGDTAATLEIS